MSPNTDPRHAVFLDSMDKKADELRNGHPDKLNGLCDLVADLAHLMTAQVRTSVTAKDCEVLHAKLREDVLAENRGATITVLGREVPVQVITSAVTGIGALTMWPTVGALVFFFGRCKGWF